ncbi:hypothetical protein H4Q26_008658 [Puccinia striiformis f. sp. tritici PST-130]|nr:hypothetical protein H4Q26_008658 [Puccinia striiformis f. sp. tritici PST-130]
MSNLSKEKAAKEKELVTLRRQLATVTEARDNFYASNRPVIATSQYPRKAQRIPSTVISSPVIRESEECQRMS